MSQFIVILDDEPQRIPEMQRWLSKKIPEKQLLVFDNAPEMIAWLEHHVAEAQLICLDHDLGPNRRVDGRTFDPGIGRDVANYLATVTPVCPVIIHTTNSVAAPGMAMVLEDAGWAHSAVVPYNDVQWIGEAWIDAVLAALRTN